MFSLPLNNFGMHKELIVGYLANRTKLCPVTDYMYCRSPEVRLFITQRKFVKTCIEEEMSLKIKIGIGVICSFTAFNAECLMFNAES